ncbi:MAG: hypothetical protein IJD88_04970 [Clostridia bacterium]|nr:hypothetical protein [Clostridia bacterium]
MKKLISILLAIVIMSASVLPVFAAETDKVIVTQAESFDELKKVDYPIIFITGIGQNWTRLHDGNGGWQKDEFDSSKEYRYNMISFRLKNMFTMEPLKTLKVLTQLLATLIKDKNFVSPTLLADVLAAICDANILDENGNLPDYVENTIRRKPISMYEEKYEKDRFYRSVPCKKEAQIIGEENIYCFSAPAFAFTYDNAAKLDEFINEVVLNGYSKWADKVVLVPMSMGATIVNAYLDEYGTKNQVAKVVSIVGAWDGSDVIADLIEGKYAENSAEMFYNGELTGIIADLIINNVKIDDQPIPSDYRPLFAALIQTALRLWSQSTLRDLIDTIIEAIREGVLLKTPSLLALIPEDRYEAIKKTYLSDPEDEYIVKQTERYYEAQKNRDETMKMLKEKYGLEFYFICGYNLEFGGAPDSDYSFMKMLYSAAKTNSDEIIQISSTAPGTECAPAGTKLETPDEDGKYRSPDESIDLSSSFAPDRTWCFNKQKHELEDNNSAITLALELATGKITDIYDKDCEGRFPQFNESRDLEVLYDSSTDYIKKLKDYVKNNINKPESEDKVKIAENLLAEIAAMEKRTINNRAQDDALIKEARDFLINVGYIEGTRETKSFEKAIITVVEVIGQILYDIYEIGGFRDHSFFA